MSNAVGVNNGLFLFIFVKNFNSFSFIVKELI